MALTKPLSTVPQMENTDNKLSMSQTTHMLPNQCVPNTSEIGFLSHHHPFTPLPLTLHTPSPITLPSSLPPSITPHTLHPSLLTSSPPSPTSLFTSLLNHHHSILTPPSSFTLQGLTLQSVVRGWTWRMGRRGAPSHRTPT